MSEVDQRWRETIAALKELKRPARAKGPAGLLDTVSAAKRMGIAKGTLENWRSLGKGPRFIKVGTKMVRYDPRDIDSWLENGDL